MKSILAILLLLVGLNTQARWVMQQPDIYGCVGWWTFNNSGLDFSGQNQNSAVTNGTSFVAGKIGLGLSCNGNNNATIYPSGGVYQLSVFTISLWCKPAGIIQSGSTQSDCVNYTGSLASDRYGFIFGFSSNSGGNTGQLQFTVGTGLGGGGWNVYSSTTSTFSASTWYHVVGIYNGTSYAFYINGQLNGSGTGISISYSVISSQLYVGCGSSQSFGFNGILDDVRIYNRAISSNEVLELYGGGYGCSHK